MCRLPARRVRLAYTLQLDRVHMAFAYRLIGLRLAAPWAAVGEAGLIRLQLKLFLANRANFDWKRH